MVNTEKLSRALHTKDAEIINAVSEKLRPWGKKEVLLRKGDVADKLFFLNKGLAFIITDYKGKARVRHIAEPGEFLTSIESYEKHSPSTEQIIAPGKHDIYYLSRFEFNLLQRKYGILETIYQGYLLSALVAHQSRINDMLTLETDDYYSKLMSEKYDIIEQVPPYVLANYFGLDAQSISRIRNSVHVVS